MLVFLNGQFVPESQAFVPVNDRGFMYGDGLFETMRVFNGRLFRWAQHLERLERGAKFLKIKLPFSAEALRSFADELVVKNQMPDSLLRLTLSRGVGLRGYSPKGAERPTLLMSLHSAPALEPGRADLPVGPDARCTPKAFGAGRVPAPKWKLITGSPHLPAGEPLAQFKTCNKLPQILARAEADAAGADEALLLNTDGFVAEGTSSNLFWIEREAVCTPPLASGILPGVTRAVVLDICRSLGVKTRESNVTSEELKHREEIFLTLSSWGIVEAKLLDGRVLHSCTVVEKLRRVYWDLVRAETA